MPKQRPSEKLIRELADGTIRYGKEIERHREPPSPKGPEEKVRAAIIRHLIDDLGYKPENVLIEVKVRARAGRNSRDKYADIALRRVSKRKQEGMIWLLGEIKEREAYERERLDAWESQLFGLAKFTEGNQPKILMFGTADQTNIPEVEVVDTEKFKSYEKWEKAGRPIAARSIPPNFGQPKKEKLVRGGSNDLKTVTTQEELNRLQRELHNILWGGGALGDTDIFNLITRLLVAKVQDEGSVAKNDQYRFQVLHDEDLESDTLPRINKLFQSGLTSRLSGISQTEAKQHYVWQAGKGTLAQLRFAIESLEQLNISEIAKGHDGDLLGQFFEDILRRGYKQTKGQFFTHQNIVRFMIEGMRLREWTRNLVLEKYKLPLILDPCAGSGTFLIEAMKAIADELKELDRTKDNFSNAAQTVIEDAVKTNRGPRNRWAKQQLYGLEINGDLALAAQLNMMLHSDGSSSILGGAQHGSGLNPFSEYPNDKPELKNSSTGTFGEYEYPMNEQFDAILTNPPFSAQYSKEE